MLDPFTTNRLSHHYHLDDSTFILEEIGMILNFSSFFFDETSRLV